MTTRTTVRHDLRVGERLSFDGGRIVAVLEAKSGQQVRLRLHLQKDVVFDQDSKRSKPVSTMLRAVA